MTFRPTNPFDFLDPQSIINAAVQGGRDLINRDRQLEDEARQDFLQEQDALVEQMQRVLAAPDLTQPDRQVLEEELLRLEGLSTSEELQSFLSTPRTLPGTPENFTGPFSAPPSRNFRGVLGEIAARVTLAEEGRTRDQERLEESQNFARDNLFPIWLDLTIPQVERRNMFALWELTAPEGALDPEERAAAFAATGIQDDNALALVQEDLRGRQLVNQGTALDNDAKRLGNALGAATLQTRIDMLDIQLQTAGANLGSINLSNDLAEATMPATIRAVLAGADTAEAQAAITQDDVVRERERFYFEVQQSADAEQLRQLELTQLGQVIEQERVRFEREGIVFDEQVDDRFMAEILAARDTGLDDNLTDAQKEILARYLGVRPGTPGYESALRRRRQQSNAVFEAEQQNTINVTRASELGLSEREIALNILQSDRDWQFYLRDRQKNLDLFGDSERIRGSIFQAMQAGDVGLIEGYLLYLSNPGQYQTQSQILEAQGITIDQLMTAKEAAEEVVQRNRTDAALREQTMRTALRATQFNTQAQQYATYQALAVNFTSPGEVDRLPQTMLDEIGEEGVAVLKHAIARRTILEGRQEAIQTLDAMTQVTPTNRTAWRVGYDAALVEAGITNPAQRAALIEGWMNEFDQRTGEDEFTHMKNELDLALIEARIREADAQTLKALRGDGTAFDEEFFTETDFLLDGLESSIESGLSLANTFLAESGCGTFARTPEGALIAESLGRDASTVEADPVECDAIRQEKLEPIQLQINTLLTHRIAAFNARQQAGRVRSSTPGGAAIDSLEGVTSDNGLLSRTVFETTTGLDLPFRTSVQDLNIFSFGQEDLNAAGNAAFVVAQNTIALRGGGEALVDNTSLQRISQALVRFYGSPQEAQRQVDALIAQFTQDFGIEEAP